VAGRDPASPQILGDALTGATALFVNVAAVGGSVAALLTEAARHDVGRVVLLSSLTVRDNGTQPYSIGAHHKAVEDAIASSGLDWTFLRCGGFAANTLAWAPMIRTDGVVRAPYGGAATAPIAERDIASAAARVLTGDGHSKARYVLTGQQSLTQIEQAQAIGTAIGRSVRFEELPADVFRAAAAPHMPAAVVDDLLRYLAGYVGRTAEIAPDLEAITGQPATTFADWAAENAASFQPSGRSAR
jgi:uncharacterized protein YbjT (DUF2867 family)